MSKLKGTVSQKVLLVSLQALLVEGSARLKKMGKLYDDELMVACEVVRTHWSSRETMKVPWGTFYGSTDHFIEKCGRRTTEYVDYLNSKDNFLSLFKPVVVCPELKYEMLDEDWEVLERGGHDYIDNLQIGRVDIGNVGRGGSQPYVLLIDDIMKQHIDIENMRLLFVGRNLRERFQVLLDKVIATELDSVTLDDDSLALIHEMKSNTTV